MHLLVFHLLTLVSMTAGEFCRYATMLRGNYSKIKIV